MAYSVSRRTQEMGLRMALGADRGTVLKMVLRQALTQGLVGVAAGMCAAFFLVRLLSGELFGVSTRDPAVFLAVAALLVLLTAASAWIPAHRASRLDPVQALRME
jgi:ABC-type antimicrobial peptide transport system permease subunit